VVQKSVPINTSKAVKLPYLVNPNKVGIMRDFMAHQQNPVFD